MSLELELRVMLRDVVREVVREEIGERRSTTLASELLTYEQAALMVSVSQSTIKRWVRSGLLDTVGSGKLRRIRPEALRACMSGTSSVQPPPAAPDIKATVTSILASVAR